MDHLEYFLVLEHLFHQVFSLQMIAFGIGKNLYIKRFLETNKN